MAQTNLVAYNSLGQVATNFDFKGQRTEFYYDRYGRMTNKFYFVPSETHPSNAVSYAYNQLGQITNITQLYGTNAANSYAVLDNVEQRFQPVSLFAKMVACVTATAPKWGGPLVAFVSFCLIFSLSPGRKLRRLLVEFYLHGGWRLENGWSGLPARIRRQLAAERPVSQYKLARWMPHYFWRFVTIMTLISLIGNDQSLERFWIARADCSIPQNFSTDNTRITSFVYDFDGHLAQINTPEGVINYGYDLATGRLTNTCTANSYLSYSYDLLGRLKTVTTSKRNGVSITPETTTYYYDKVGNRSEVDLPNGVVTKYLYDTVNRLTNMTHYAGTTNLAAYSYMLDATGRRTNATEILRQEDNTYLTNNLTWQFDGMYRLTNEISLSTTNAGPSYAFTNAYQYDLAGNRLRQTRTGGGAETITYAYDSNDELLGETNASVLTTYAYDSNGSLTNKATGTTNWDYGYGLFNKLSSVAYNGTPQESYQYNDEGIRVRTMGASTNYYLIDAYNHTGYQQVLEEFLTLGGAPARSYVIGDDVLAQGLGTSPLTPSYFLADGHGSTRQMVSNAGGISSRYNYDAYGITQTATSTTTPETSLLYCREQYDSTLQMYNLRARYYNPNNGRFNQRDTFAGNNFDPQSLHKYTYTHSDPVNGIDPTGQFTLVELLVVIAIISVLYASLLPSLTKVKQNAHRRIAVASGKTDFQLEVERNPSAFQFDSICDDQQQTYMSYALEDGNRWRQIELAQANNQIWAVNSIETLGTANDLLGFALGGTQIAVAAETLESTEFLASDIKVIGRSWDTDNWVGQPGRDVLKMLNSNEGPHAPDGFIWSIENNDRWVAEGIANRQIFFCASPEEGNLWQTSGRFAGQETIFRREIMQLKAAGYVKVGDYYVPAEKAATFKP